MSKQFKGLGKGLDAIFQSNSTTNDYPTNKSNDKTVNEIELGKIKPNPAQPRTEFDQDALNELAQSISRLGIIQPITVKENEEFYTIISGERRFRAAKMAGLTTIPVYIRKVGDQELLEMALVENIQREELNAIEIALTLNRLLKDCNLTQIELSERVGKPRPTIANYVRLLTLPAEVQAAIKACLISMGHARTIAGVKSYADQIYVLEQILIENLSVRQTEELTQKLNLQNYNIKTTKTEKILLPQTYNNIAAEFTAKLGSKVAITLNKKGNGKITIKFNSEKELLKIQDLIK